ncbi:DUF6381 family protein [Streptomyces sp. NPDC005373]|uniref:DUF6381 family protein n=1 Tax=Streptomyces sp. NPDC005373 TaxID=3156879 RepID=UPI0033A57C0A
MQTSETVDDECVEHCLDPQERQRLKDKARQLKEQSEHIGGTGKQDIDPTM